MKKVLLAGAAIAVFATPAVAQRAPDPSDDNTVSNFELDYRNNLNTSIVTDVRYFKDVRLIGTVLLEGRIRTDASAVAVSDVKQTLTGNQVTFREENELNGENGFVSDVFGGSFSENGNVGGDDGPGGLPDPFVYPRIRVGFFAPIINTVNPFDVNGSGNIGVNAASGWYNQQANVATLAVATASGQDDNNDGIADAGGWAEASTTGLQRLDGTLYGRATGTLEEDEEGRGGGGNNFRERNTATLGTIGGTGNIGVNAAAGAFNQQANIMTLAVANDSALAEANAGVWQASALNRAEIQDSINVVDIGVVGGAGNIGVNIASGVGNQQHNSLTAAVSGAFGTAGGPGTGGPDRS